MFCSVYSVSLYCSMYCLCVNVYCTTDTGCQPNCSSQICELLQVEYSNFSAVLRSKWGLGLLIFEVSISHTAKHTQTHKHTAGMTPLNECSACRTGRYLHNSQQTQKMKIHAFSGIRTNDRAAANLLLRPHGYWNQRKFH